MTGGVRLAGCRSDGGGDGDSNGNGAGTTIEDTETTSWRGAGGSDETSTTALETDGQTSGRELPGDVRNDLSGLEVVEHTGTVEEESFSGSVTVRHVGDETASLLDHEIEIELFDDGGTLLDDGGSWSGDVRELAPDEQGVMEFSPGPTADVDFSLVGSYEVVSQGRHRHRVHHPRMPRTEGHLTLNRPYLVGGVIDTRPRVGRTRIHHENP